MPGEEVSIVVKHCCTSGAWPGLVLVKMMLVYDAATKSSPDEEPPYSERHLRWTFLARVIILPGWAVAAEVVCAVTQHELCLMAVNDKGCCSSVAAFQCCTKGALMLLCCTNEGPSCGYGGQNMHGEKHRPAFYFCCFVGQAIHCEHADMAPASCYSGQ